MADPPRRRSRRGISGCSATARRRRQPRTNCRSRRPSACSSRRCWRGTTATSAWPPQQLGMSRSALYRRLQHYGVRELAAPRSVHWSLEQAVLGLTLLAGLPAAVALAWIVWGAELQLRGALDAGRRGRRPCGSAARAAAYQMVTRVALSRRESARRAARGGLLDPRRPGAKPGSAADLVMKEINSLGDTLQRQRSEAVESTALLDERDGRDRRRGLRLRHGRALRAGQPGGRAAARTSRRPTSLGRDARELRLDAI